MPRCAGFKPDNTQCERIVDGRSTYCYSHDPDRKEQRRRAASKAGRAKPGSEMAELKAKLKTLYDDVRTGKVNSGIGSVCSQIAGTQIKVLDLEVREREVRVKELEYETIKLPEFQSLEQEVAELKEMLEEKETRRRSSSWAG